MHRAIEEGNARVDSMLALELSLQAAGLTANRRGRSVRGAHDERARESSLKAARILAASSSLKEKYVVRQENEKNRWNNDASNDESTQVELER